MPAGRPKTNKALPNLMPCFRIAKDAFKEARFHCQVFAISLSAFQRDAILRHNIFYRSLPLTAQQIALHDAVGESLKEQERLNRIKAKQQEIYANIEDQSEISGKEPIQGQESSGQEGEEIVEGEGLPSDEGGGSSIG